MRAGGYELRGAVVADALAGFFAEKGEAAAGAAAEAALVVAWGFHNGPGKCGDGAGLVLDVAVTAQVAGVVEDDGFGSLGG